MEDKSYNVTISVFCADGRCNSVSRTYPANSVASIFYNAKRDAEDISEDDATTVVSFYRYYDDNGITNSEILFVKTLQFDFESQSYILL
jgi:hypothetical protein